MNNNEEEKNVILINKMYTGSYLDDNDGNNIGHEIINFFKDDIGNNYIYITPYGGPKNLKSDIKDRIKYVLFTSPTVKGRYTILAKAEVKKCLFVEETKNQYNHIFRDKYRDIHNKQAQEIIYNNKRIYDIYKDNINNDEAIYATFLINDIKKANKKIEVNLKGNKDKENVTIISVNNEEKYFFKYIENKPQLKMIRNNNFYGYYKKEKKNNPSKENINQALTEIIDKEEYWKETENKLCNKNANDIEFNFLNLIGKEYDESVYTNMLEFYFNVKYKNEGKTDIILNKFLSWLSKNKKEFNCDSERFDFQEISKEFPIIIRKNSKEEKKDEEESKTNSENISKGRMDFFASKDNTYLVIENKIKSKINGNEESGYQLNFYKNAIEANYTNPKFIGIIFVPNYNEEIIKNEEGYKKVQNDYTIVYYDEIYDFFAKEITEKNMLDKNAKHYYSDFIKALYIHTLDAKAKEENKFKKAILNIKEVQYIVFVVSFRKIGNDDECKYYIGTTNNLNRRIRELSETGKFKGYEIKEKIIWQKRYEDLRYAVYIEEKLEQKLEEKLNKLETILLSEKDIKEQVVEIENNIAIKE